jgi:predicted deacylase
MYEDYVDTVIYYESAPYTKPDKPLNAYDFTHFLMERKIMDAETGGRLISIMKELGMWQGEINQVKKPHVARDNQVTYINSESSGIFIPNVDVHDKVEAGMLIGSVVNVLTGTVEQKVVAPTSGTITAIREYPAIEMGSLLARIVDM